MRCDDQAVGERELILGGVVGEKALEDHWMTGEERCRNPSGMSQSAAGEKKKALI